MDTRRLQWLGRPALALLSGAALGLAWWDWAYPGWVEVAWQGERVYRFFWVRLIWICLAAASITFTAWWAGRGDPAKANAKDGDARMRPYLPFFVALLAPLTLARYAFHPLGVQPGSSAWTYLLIAVTAGAATLVLAQSGIWHTAAGQLLPGGEGTGEAERAVKAPSILAQPLGGLWVVGVAAAAYLLVFGALSVVRYQAFRAHGLDLGTMDQAAWNTIHGRVLERTPLYRHPAAGSRYENRLLDAKLELVFLPLSSLYALWSDPRLLLIVQTAALAAGAIPLYALARERLAPEAGTQWPAALLAVAYLAYLPLHYVNMADFHPSALMVPALIAAWRAMQLRRWTPYYLWLGLALLCRIDAALIGLGLGATMVLTQRDARRHGVWTMGIAMGWLALDFAVVVPAVRALYGPGAGDLVRRRFAALGGGPLGVLRTVVTRPLVVVDMLVDLDKVQALVDLLAASGALGLLAPWALVPALPVLVTNLLSESTWQQSIHAHYMAPVIPFVWIAAVEGVAWISRRIKRTHVFHPYARPGVLAFAALLCTTTTGWALSPFPLGRAFRLADLYQPSAYERDLRAVLAQVPDDATVCAQSDLHPHLSQRRDAALYPRCAIEVGVEAEYIVLDLDPTAIKSPLDHHAFYELLEQTLAREAYGVVAYHGSGLLLQRGAPRHNVPDVLRALEAYGAGLYRVSYVTASPPARLFADDYVRVPLALRNTGTQNWQARGTLPVRVSYRWIDAAGQPVLEVPALHTDLPHRVAPGHAVQVRAALLTPPMPGSYTLEWDLLREGDAWFGTRGGETLRQAVQVE